MASFAAIKRVGKLGTKSGTTALTGFGASKNFPFISGQKHFSHSSHEERVNKIRNELWYVTYEGQRKLYQALHEKLAKIENQDQAIHEAMAQFEAAENDFQAAENLLKKICVVSVAAVAVFGVVVKKIS